MNNKKGLEGKRYSVPCFLLSANEEGGEEYTIYNNFGEWWDYMR